MLDLAQLGNINSGAIHTIAAATRVFGVVPSASNVTPPLEDDKISRLILPYHIDRHAHPFQ